jgi:hypothetical protein
MRCCARNKGGTAFFVSAASDWDSPVGGSFQEWRPIEPVAGSQIEGHDESAAILEGECAG